jgi:hypothetical protein
MISGQLTVVGNIIVGVSDFVVVFCEEDREYIGSEGAGGDAQESDELHVELHV